MPTTTTTVTIVTTGQHRPPSAPLKFEDPSKRPDIRHPETARRAVSGSTLKLPRTFRIRVSELLSFSAIHNTGPVYTGPGTGPRHDRDHSVYVGGRGADLFAAAASRARLDGHPWCSSGRCVV